MTNYVTDRLLHIMRNPHGFSFNEQRDARLLAADMMEVMERELGLRKLDEEALVRQIGRLEVDNEQLRRYIDGSTTLTEG